VAAPVQARVAIAGVGGARYSTTPGSRIAGARSALRRASQHPLQKTSRPASGWNGTLAALPHPVHVACHTGRSAEGGVACRALLRVSRHGLQRLGGTSPRDA
jgi:hypothetical protein